MYTARAIVDNFNSDQAELLLGRSSRFWRIDSVGDLKDAERVFPGVRVYFRKWVFERQYEEPPPTPSGIDPVGVGSIPFDVEDTLFLLRLFRSGDVGFVHHTVELPDGNILSQYPYRLFAPISSRYHYNLASSDRGAWDSFESELPRPAAWRSTWFQIARRFFLYGSSGAFQPQWDDVDRILDYCIALEAIFVPDDEFISRKLRERTSRFLHPEEAEVVKTNRLVNAFYDIRSCVAHGGQLENKHKKLCADRMPEFEATVRALLVAAVRHLPAANPERMVHLKSLYDVGDAERAEKLVQDLATIKSESALNTIYEVVKERLPHTSSACRLHGLWHRIRKRTSR